MVQLKVTPIKFGSFNPPAPTALEFGGAVAEATKQFGEQIQVTGQLVSNIEKSRARAAAAKFDAELGLEEEKIKADINNIDNWETQLEEASKKLREKHRKGFFINGRVFDSQSSLRTAQRQVGLTSHKNRLLAELGTLAVDENLEDQAKAFAEAEDEAGEAVALFKMKAEIDAAVADNIIFEAASEGILRKAQVQGILMRAAILETEDPIALVDLAERFADQLGIVASKKMARKGLKLYQEDLTRTTKVENTARLKRERVEKKVRLKNMRAMMRIARDQEGPGLTTEDLDAVLEDNPEGFSVEGLSQLDQIVANGGRGISPATMNPEAFLEAARIARGAQAAAPGETAEETIVGLAAGQQIPPGMVESLIQKSLSRKFSPAQDVLERIAQRMAINDPVAMLKISNAMVLQAIWELDHPDATPQEAMAQVRVILKANDPYEILTSREAARPKDLVLRSDGSADITASEAALKLRRLYSENGTIGPDEPEFLSADEFRGEFEKLRVFIDAQKITEALDGSD